MLDAHDLFQNHWNQNPFIFHQITSKVTINYHNNIQTKDGGSTTWTKDLKSGTNLRYTQKVQKHLHKYKLAGLKHMCMSISEYIDCTLFR